MHKDVTPVAGLFSAHFGFKKIFKTQWIFKIKKQRWDLVCPLCRMGVYIGVLSTIWSIHWMITQWLGPHPYCDAHDEYIRMYTYMCTYACKYMYANTSDTFRYIHTYMTEFTWNHVQNKYICRCTCMCIINIYTRTYINILLEYNRTNMTEYTWNHVQNKHISTYTYTHVF